MDCRYKNVCGCDQSLGFFANEIALQGFKIMIYGGYGAGSDHRSMVASVRELCGKVSA